MALTPVVLYCTKYKSLLTLVPTHLVIPSRFEGMAVISFGTFLGRGKQVPNMFRISSFRPPL
jgi:hypothetical protein